MIKQFGLQRMRPLLLVMSAVLLLACASQQDSPDGTVVVQQSPNDDRGYRYLTLDNQLRVLLVSDAGTEKAAAALDVYVGSGQNPPDRGGLAHFLEHMLFLGTDKYPVPGEYAEYISQHGGSHNAYTAFDHTNYFFEIEKDYLPGALDRFAQFFISPRFDAEYVEREVNAVHAEYQLGLKTDSRRNLDVAREIVNPQHPFSILGVGTRDTLAERKGESVRDELLAFYDRYYSANIMTLVVIGRESLDELEALARNSFSAVPNRDTQVELIDVPLYRPQDLPLLVYIQPEASERELQLSFPLPVNYEQTYRRKSLKYIGNLIGHEGEGSLLSMLKAEGWAEALGAGAGIAYRDGGAFSIGITLTEAGLEQHEQVLDSVFAYIRLLQEKGPVRALYEEQARVAALDFRFREQGKVMSYATSLAHDMQYFEPEDVLRGNFLMEEFDAAEIKEILARYLDPENVAVTVIAADLPVDRESEFYFTPYSVRTLGEGEGSWRQLDDSDIDDRLALPKANDFIADNVEMKPVAADNPAAPALMVDSERLKIWFRQDEEFAVPKGAMYLSFRAPEVSDSPRQAALAMLYVALLRDGVNEYTYPAMLAGLDFDLYKHARGISLKISGYDDKQLRLLGDIVQSIKNAELDNSRFANILADQVRGLENYRTTRPFRQVMTDASQVLRSGEWGEEELAEELREMTPAQVQAFADGFWPRVRVEVLLNGNYDEATITGVREILKPLLPEVELPVMADMRVVKLEPGSQYVYDAPIEHSDSVLLWYMQAPGDDWANRGMAAMTGQLLRSGFYRELRTEQQLGYVVSAFSWPVLEVPGLAFLVQSPVASSDSLAVAMLEYLELMATDEGVDEETFLRHRSALVADILQPHKNLWERSDYFWREISRRELDFSSSQQLAGAVGSIGYRQWQDWYQQILLDQRASVAFAARGRWEDLPPGELIENPVKFRERQQSYSRP